MQNALVSILPFPFVSLRTKSRTKSGFKLLKLLIAGAALSFVALCVVQVNSYARDTYLIQEYQNRIAQLSDENKTMELNSLSSNSLVNMGTYVQSQSFEKADKIQYIKILEGTAVAK
jgi:hypothetical protein